MIYMPRGIKKIKMKNILKALLLIVMFAGATESRSQFINPGDKIPAGAIVYSLPVTSLHFIVEVTYESFTAGPYARFSQKYLGVQAREESGDAYQISNVEVIPYIEADQSANIALNLGNSKTASANFMEMINQGLIMWSDSYAGKSEKLRFPDMKSNTLFVKSMSTSNLTSEKSTLYRTASSPTGSERSAVQQSQVVEKSAEKRAEESANMIFKLRTKRLEIITGETDATFSGDALRAAIDEINRLEDEYLGLFFGKIRSGSQKMSFDVMPKADNEKQIYIAFRLSDTQGLLPSNNLAGRPIVLELLKESEQPGVTMDVTSGRGRVVYRKPAMMNLRLMDGQNVLMQSRVPVYQLGNLLSFPLEIATGKL
ncbi:MAG: hypothetical protein CVU13_10520 [Bacteroidetes bacterium HGW-Bacteroidetes-8]|jgi:hypothetical protein|nr:MAG: hypothetical protein CVU13_10520 [Bacteroidetes bacterium HGW-Bacteroidetes-8]